ALPPFVAGEDVGRRPLDFRLVDRPLRLLPEVAEEELPVVGEVRERDEQSGLLVVVVVAERPLHPRQRRVLPPPGALRLARAQLPLDRLGGTPICPTSL